MDGQQVRVTIERFAATTANTPWSNAYWFVFTYPLPAFLAGREVPMR
jgi:hypothetical protein